MVEGLTIKVVLFVCLCFLQSACKPVSGGKPDALSSLSESKSQLKPVQVSDSEDTENKQAVKTLVKDLEAKLVSEQLNRDVVIGLLRHQDVFAKMLNDCDGRFSGGGVKFSDIYKVDTNRYIVKLLCSTGAYQPAFVYYLYNETTGLNTKALKLARFQKDETGRLLRKYATYVAGLDTFNEKTGEIQLHYRAAAMTWCGYKATYKFEDNQLILREFLADNNCSGVGRSKPEYVKVYP